MNFLFQESLSLFRQLLKFQKVFYRDWEMIGELNEKELVEELKNLREEIEVMRRVLKNVEEIEGVYYEEYLKRGEE